jgi:hypothetical protein
MEMEEAIGKALLVHGEWKRRLVQVIGKNGEGLSVEVVSSDDQCEFGKWLNLELGADIRSLPSYERAKKLHADFHREAGRVLTLAKNRQRFEAMAALDPVSEFARISGALTLTLDQWRFRTRRATQELAAIPK